MRAIGKRSISFGLVSVPVKIYTATEDHDIALHQVHDKDGGRIHYERRCDVCGKVIPFEHIDRAYDSGDRTVVIDDDDLESLPEASRDDIEVVEFVPSDQLDPITFERSYYLEPEKGGVKAYVLLRRTLERTERTAIVQFALRTKTHLGALRVHDDGVMVLQSLLWGDEVREADFSVLEKPPRITPKEQELADALVKSLESDFRPAEYKDEYQEELRQLIEAKLKKGDSVDTSATFGEEAAEGEEEGEGAEVVDLMEALRRSVDKKKPAPKRQTHKRAG
jgi:DNA end-binding protein Ku